MERGWYRYAEDAAERAQGSAEGYEGGGRGGGEEGQGFGRAQQVFELRGEAAGAVADGMD